MMDQIGDIDAMGDELPNEMEEEKISNLVSTVSSMFKTDGKKKVAKRSEPSVVCNEFGVATDRKTEKVQLNQLLNNVVDKDGKIKTQLRKITHKKLIKPPLDTPTAKKIKRQVLYDETVKDISKWEPIIEQNRQKPQLEFPLERPDLRLEGPQNKFITKTNNKLKEEIDEALKQSDNVIKEPKVLTAAEEKFLSQINIEEARMRHANLRKMRALLSYQEAKLKRQSKIKSKKYRRILKKEKLKKELAEFEKTKNTDPDKALEKIEQLDKMRALERASLKHRNTGKWAKQNLLRSKYDEEVRKDIKEQMEINKTLTKKVTFDLEEDEPIEAIEEDDLQEGEIIMKSGSYEEKESNPWLLREPSSTVTDSSVPIIEPTSSDAVIELQTEIPDFQNMGSDEESEDNEGNDEHAKLIAEAFDGDDVIMEFSEMKKDLIDKETAKDSNLYLPGWGSWTGPGMVENKKLKKKFTIKAKQQKRKDSDLPNVIISEDKDKAISKFLVKELPFNCKNVSSFEKKLKTPIGPDWNPETKFRFNIEPKIVTHMGKIIEPINEKALVKHEKRRKPFEQIAATMADVIPV